MVYVNTRIVQEMDKDGSRTVDKREFLRNVPLPDEDLAEAVFSALDTNDDGVIDGNDTPGGQDLIGSGWEVGYVPLSRIRAVRIWLLARTRVPLRNYTDTDTYIVGDKHIDARDTNRDGTVDASDKPDNYKRRLLTATVKCRNLGL